MTETHKIGAGTIDEWPENADLDGWSFTYLGQRRKAEAGVGILCGPNAELIQHSNRRQNPTRTAESVRG